MSNRQISRTRDLLIAGANGEGNTVEEQLQDAYTDIRGALADFGVSPDSVVKENIYTTDFEALKQDWSGPRKQFYGDATPASFWYGVTRLYDEDAKIEIEVIATLKV